MPRNGSGIYALPVSYLAVTGEEIQANQHNLPLEDLAADANAVRPVGAGGTGGATPAAAREALGAHDASNLTTGTVDDARLPYTQSGKKFTSLVEADKLRLTGQAVDFGSSIQFARPAANTGLTADVEVGVYQNVYRAFELAAPAYRGWQVNLVTGEIYTSEQGRFWSEGNDGHNSGLDADMLDGQQGSWYADIVGRLGYTPLNQASYTAVDVLAKLLTVDGAGSGIDADLLDGQHGSFYRDAGNMNAGILPSGRLSGDYLEAAVATSYRFHSGTYGANDLTTGNGDGASYSTGNLDWYGWWGLRMLDRYTFICTGFFDFRVGKWDVKGGYYVDGQPVPVVSLTSAADELNFPVGHIIQCFNSASTGALNRNAQCSPRLSTTGTYTTGGSGALLSGTWRSRGSQSDTLDDWTLVQRVA